MFGMRKKKHYLVPSVVSREALNSCIQQNAMVFAIENLLYASICEQAASMEELANYSLEWHTDKNIIVLFKASGKNRYNANKYQLVYLPLQWT